MRRIAAVVSANGKRLIPHVGGQYAYHFLASQADAFLAEFPVMSGHGDTIAPQHEPLLRGESLPVDGRISLDESPGFGLTLDESVTLLRPITSDWSVRV